MSLNIQSKLKNLIKNKKALGIILILFLVIIWGLLNSKFSFDKYDATWDMRGYYDINSILVRESIIDNHQFPLWVPYIYGGTPYFQYPQGPIFNVANMLVLIFPSFYMAYNLLCVIQLFVIGITMYLLMLELKLDYKYALIAAFTFMFNRYNLSTLMSGGEQHFDSLMWLPAIFLFAFRAYKRKDWLKNSIFAGMFMAIAFHGGDGSTFTYMLFFIGLLFVYLFLTTFKKYKKVILIFVVFAIVLGGLSAIRLFPLLDFGKVSDLGGGRSLESSRGYHIEKDSFPNTVVTVVRGLVTEDSHIIFKNELKIGWVIFILALLALPLIKNKYVLFFVISILVLINLSIGSHLFYLLWKFFPGFNKQHHIIRVLHLVPFCFSVLAGFGSSFLFKNIFGKIKKRWVITMVFIAFFIILGLGLPYISPRHPFKRINMEEDMNRNHLMVYLSKAGQEDLFRVHNLDRFNQIGGGGQSQWIPMGISTIHGNLNTFESEYLFQFVNPVASSNPSKILGMYNTKYFYLDRNITNPDITFVKKFADCNESCEDFGPYLYLNKKYVPRSYIVNNTILIIGEKQNAVNTMYALILDDNFSPANLAIVPMDVNDVNKHDIDFFSRFDTIIIINRPTGDLSVFRQYENIGGRLLPNIFKGETALSQEQINSLLKGYALGYDEIKKISITDYKPNSMEIKLSNQGGFVVIAEKYFMYEGWRVNDKREILRTNGFSSGIWVTPNDSVLEFSYFPKSFKIGMTVTLITLLSIIAYLILRFMKKRSLRENQD